MVDIPPQWYKLGRTLSKCVRNSWDKVKRDIRQKKRFQRRLPGYHRGLLPPELKVRPFWSFQESERDRVRVRRLSLLERSESKPILRDPVFPVGPWLYHDPGSYRENPFCRRFILLPYTCLSRFQLRLLSPSLYRYFSERKDSPELKKDFSYPTPRDLSKISPVLG